jgi:hypothetical protein
VRTAPADGAGGVGSGGRTGIGGSSAAFGVAGLGSDACAGIGIIGGAKSGVRMAGGGPGSSNADGDIGGGWLGTVGGVNIRVNSLGARPAGCC